jgi:hypothetical protein
MLPQAEKAYAIKLRLFTMRSMDVHSLGKIET